MMLGAIFDVDGTLLDSMNVWWKMIDDFLSARNKTLTDEEGLAIKNMTLQESIPMLIEKFDLKMTFDELLEQFKQMMFKEYAENIPLKKGAYEYVHHLHDSGIKIAVATSGYEPLCRAAFERLGIWECIDALAFSSEVGVDKSNPDIYLLAAERIGVEPKDCMVFEDIAPGIHGAKKGGFQTCAVYDASNISETEELKRLADIYITDWSEMK